MPLVKSIFIKGTTDFGRAKAELDDVAARARKIGEMSPTIDLKVDDGAALLKLKAFSMELRALKDSGSQSGLSDLAGRLKSFGNEAGTSRTKMAALKLETDALKSSMGGSGGGRGGLAGAAGEAESGVSSLSGPSGMGALIAAGVVASPLLVTVGTGLAGLGAAAYGTLAPIEKAAGKTGGLSKNLGTLDAEQKTVARSILGLGKEYDSFQKALEPEVIGAFNQAIKIGGHLMTDVQPVAKATGKAFDSFLGQVDRQFQSGEFQNFFGFMAKTAGPDVRLLGANIINLTNDLPPLLEAIQPVAQMFLTTTAAALKLGGGAETAIGKIEALNNKFSITPKGPKGSESYQQFVQNIWKGLGRWAGASGTASAATSTLTGKTHGTTTAIANETAALWKQDTALLASIGSTLTLEGDQVSWRQAQQAATKAVDANKHSLDGNSASALAARQAIIGATQSALTFATAQNHTEAGVRAASRVIQDQIQWLQTHAGKSKIAAQEIAALRQEEAKLHDIRNRITVSGSGRWSISNVGPGGPGHRVGAQGMLVTGGTPGVDSVPILAQEGEAVVPKRLTPAVAPFLKAHGVPGFAAGGVVGSYTGGIPGLTGWVKGEEKATIYAIAAATAAATLAGMKAAAAQFAGGTGRGSLGIAERAWVGAGGPSGPRGYTAHIAGAIAGAESGWNPRAVQAGQPYATTGWGPWQITPGNSEPQFGVNGQLLNWGANALAAVAKYRQAGNSFSPWTTFESGAYLRFMDSGGWLRPGWNPPMYNATGGYEHLVPAARSGGTTVNYNITVHPTPLARPADIGREVVAAVRAFEKGSGSSWRK